MPNFFVDSSALVKRYRSESGSERVSELLASPNRLLIARLTVVEVSSALVRRARSTNMPPEKLRTALGAFDDDLRDSIDLIELDDPVMDARSRWHGNTLFVVPTPFSLRA